MAGGEGMLGTQDLAVFVTAGVLLNLTPGPDTVYIVTRTVAQGRRAGVLSALGICAGCLCHVFLVAFGLAGLLAASATAFQVVKFAGAAYLVYLGIQAIREKPDGNPEVSAATRGDDVAVFRQGVLTNLLNPKVVLFFLAFLPQFVQPDAEPGPVPFLFLGLVFLTTGTIWCLILVRLAAFASKGLRSNRRLVGVLEKITGGVFVALGLNLLWSEGNPR
jgi:RhtB (resistance to homoserine/threonine) family protein